MSYPVVTVLMSVFNDREYLPESVGSILGQSFQDLEFIVIEDGSTDGSREWLKEVARGDERLKLIEQNNAGLTVSLNRGLSLAKGRYLARMDGDDVSEKDRIESQLDYLKRNDSVSVVSSDMEVCNSRGEKIGEVTYPKDDGHIKFSMAFENPISHPAVFIDRSKVSESLLVYDEDYETCQDYSLWVKLAHSCNFGNVDKRLVRYRRHDGSVNATKKEKQIKAISEIRRSYLRSILSEDSTAALDFFEGKRLLRVEAAVILRAFRELVAFSGIERSDALVRMKLEQLIGGQSFLCVLKEEELLSLWLKKKFRRLGRARFQGV